MTLKEIEKKYVSRVKELESDLKLNASMLARQCDLAREAEARVKELQDAIEEHQWTRKFCVPISDIDTELYAHLAKSFEDIDK